VVISRIGLVAIIAVAGTAVAQDEQSEERDPFEGAASLGYLATSGNTDSENLNAAFSLKWQPSLWSHEFNVSVINAQTSGVTTAQARFANYIARRDFGEKSYLFASADWESDEFSAFDNQLSETVGYGRHVIATERHTLDFEIGLGARQAELRSGLEEDEAIGRGALAYARQLSETSEFTQSLIIESGSSNTSTESVSELRANIFGNVALVLSWRLRNNSDVPVGIEKTDRYTAISLEYGF
jgi:putative salt-induced outer membrane protein